MTELCRCSLQQLPGVLDGFGIEYQRLFRGKSFGDVVRVNEHPLSKLPFEVVAVGGDDLRLAIGLLADNALLYTVRLVCPGNSHGHDHGCDANHDVKGAKSKRRWCKVQLRIDVCFDAESASFVAVLTQEGEHGANHQPGAPGITFVNKTLAWQAAENDISVDELRQRVLPASLTPNERETLGKRVSSELRYAKKKLAKLNSSVAVQQEDEEEDEEEEEEEEEESVVTTIDVLQRRATLAAEKAARMAEKLQRWQVKAARAQAALEAANLVGSANAGVVDAPAAAAASAVSLANAVDDDLQSADDDDTVETSAPNAARSVALLNVVDNVELRNGDNGVNDKEHRLDAVIGVSNVDDDNDDESIDIGPLADVNQFVSSSIGPSLGKFILFLLCPIYYSYI